MKLLRANTFCPPLASFSPFSLPLSVFSQSLLLSVYLVKGYCPILRI
jgi:hypothetical protein